MKRTVLVAILLSTLIGFTAAAEEARVISARGLAQYRVAPGEDWADLVNGAIVPVGSDVSTGIGAAVVLDVNGSILQIASLSRVRVALVEQAATEDRGFVEMRYGRVSADVRRSSGRGTDFRVYTPISTAAVRGTEFVYDGQSLEVLHGDVAFINTAGQHHSVREGQLSRTYMSDPIQSVEATILEERYF